MMGGIMDNDHKELLESAPVELMDSNGTPIDWRNMMNPAKN
jgi:hypothetical protein